MNCGWVNNIIEGDLGPTCQPWKLFLNRACVYRSGNTEHDVKCTHHHYIFTGDMKKGDGRILQCHRADLREPRVDG